MTADSTVAGFIAKRLPELGVSHVFELVGGMITVLLDAMHQEPQLQVVSMHHEQAAGFAAEGFARMSGRPSVAMATSGPGATNLLTAIGSCFFDSVPVLFITGQVNRHEMSRGVIGRQGGFQETDIVAISRPLTKASILVEDPRDVPKLLDQAINLMNSGRPGPVLLDIPMDVQQARIEVPSLSTRLQESRNRAATELRSTFINALMDALNESQRPMLLVGGGVRGAGAVPKLRALLTSWKIPVASSLMGLDALPWDSPNRTGFLGSYGNRWTNRAIAESDLLLVLGSRLDVRQTGSDIDGFQNGRRIFHVDIDSSELNRRVKGCSVLLDDVGAFLDALEARRMHLPPVATGWLDEIHNARRAWPDVSENVPALGVNPNAAVRAISEVWTDALAIVTDVGQHQMWAAQSAKITEAQRFLTSGGMGSMGFGLPASIGASLASPNTPLVLIAGDGGFQLNIQELQTVKRLNLPIRIVIFDNGRHGMVRQFQESYFAGRYFSTAWGYSAPDFVALGKAYGLEARAISNEAELQAELEATLENPLAPTILRLSIDPDLNVYPKLAFGQPFGSMEPEVRPTAMEGT